MEEIGRSIGKLIGELIGASLVNVPFAGLIAWGSFGLLKRRMPRLIAVAASCGLAAAVFIILDTGSRLTRFKVYQMIAVSVWLIVGLLFWGKKKKALPLPPPPPRID